jgi:23S rRNA pseudouridine2457 synthase
MRSANDFAAIPAIDFGAIGSTPVEIRAAKLDRRYFVPHLAAPMPHRYLLFHKPYNVLSQFSDDGSAKTTLKQLIEVPDVYPVGRLDYDSEGLMLLTDDGPLQHRLSDPKFGHPRTYWVQVEQIPSDADLARIRAGGLAIQDYRTRPAAIAPLLEPDFPPRDPPIRYRQSIPTSWLTLTLTEGRNRQVRRMTAAIGFPTLRLIRWAIGDLTLDGLAPGQWRDLTPIETQNLRSIRTRGLPLARQGHRSR